MFETDGSSVNRTLFDKLGMPDPFEPLADGLCDLLHAAFVETYGDSAPRPSRVNEDPANPGFLSKQQIRDTYEIMGRVLHISRKMVVRRPEEPFSGVADVLADALAGVFEAPPSPRGWTPRPSWRNEASAEPARRLRDAGHRRGSVASAR